VFEELIKGLEGLNKMTVSVPLQCDDEGYIDKECPAEGCLFQFKVKAEDWERIAEGDAVWCPMCRHEASPNKWYTTEQVEHSRDQALEVFKGEVHNALVAGAERFNRQQPRGGFITMSMKVEGRPVQTAVIPATAAQAMQLKIECEACHTHYAVIGSAYFCPACGHNSVTRTFSDSLKKIQVKSDSLDTIRQALTQATGKDEAEVACRSLLESCISDGVVAFQLFCEGLYSGYDQAPFNAFQRLEQGSKLWRDAIGKGYDDWLTPDELQGLKLLYQKRHLLAHSDGLVDEQYLTKSGDTRYRVGQRIVISDHDVGELVTSLDKLGVGLKVACGKA
jgi:RNA polymerase subunit RPABC4/transcription elongation factor Spt4